MTKILNNEKPDDFIIATGDVMSLETIIINTFKYFELNWENHVVINEEFKRNNEPSIIKANPSKANKELDWHPKIKKEILINKLIEKHLKLTY